MGNNPSSTSKPATPVSSNPASAHDSPKNPKRDSKHIIPHRTTERVAAPPEASLHQAQGSTISKASRPLQYNPIAGIASASPSSSPKSNNSAPPPRPSDSKTIPRDEPTKPLDVPTAHTEPSSLRSHISAHVDGAPEHRVSSQLLYSYLTRPPRLPLPIEEEVHTPGSPIIAPADGDTPIVDPGSLDSDPMTRKSSALSSNTVDDDDGEELIKVYVTGTIFQWNRKQRLHPVEGKPGVFSGTVHILPGTHHVRFLVDGIMQTSPDLPTTVDFGNNLVNYIEVSADDLPSQNKAGQDASAAAGAGAADGQAAVKPSASQTDDSAKPLPRGKSVPSASQYFHQIPKYLVDFDQAEDSPSYQYAVTAIEKLPTPPSLPGFLGKPILNAAVLMKDDNSVLNMPNHTVLNHLATSSIKNNILAVSATTRYKSKYVTTIVYKPTSTDD
ncbi:SNF1 protein kinase subunit beta-3 like [Verticillium longisporum]|uniref:SNF1 protein kinase subunit beta-3 like n=1 Tax=Verticillium longisporum TaxID=100787 RepID=A0A8I2ZE46_VERLO|nr:SNF1 protein kinase subunit beta-3 like [Verticillium longisporum]